MKNILLNKTFFTLLLLIISFFTIITSITVYAEQIGIPETSIIVSLQNSATDSEDCGTNLTPTCRTIQQAVNRIAPGGSITVLPGTYNENILVDKEDIVISSIEGRSQTIINGSDATDETISEAMRIIADGVTIGWENSAVNGFTFRNSVASGLFNIGSDVTISGNAAENNGARGFQFGLSTVDDFIDNSSKDIMDDPLNGVTVTSDNVSLQTQSNVTVSNNTATDNALGGFYFSAFDNSLVHDNSASNNRGAEDPVPVDNVVPMEIIGLGQGSGFWVDSGSNSVILDRNSADDNSGDGVFYRRGFGEHPGGLVTNQSAIGNRVTSNGRHGIVFMGNNIIAHDNIAMLNQGDGFRFMGYETVLDVSYNAVIRNSGAGLGFAGQVFDDQNALVSPLTFNFSGHPEFGGIHHNLVINNLSHKFPALGGNFDRCGIATILDNGTVIEMSHNFWGGNQEICDRSGNTVQQNNSAQGTNGLGPYGLGASGL